MRGSPANSKISGFYKECSGASDDLVTFSPHVIGPLTVAGLATTGVLSGFAAFLIVTGFFYELPTPVQPMKAVSAVIPLPPVMPISL